MTNKESAVISLGVNGQYTIFGGQRSFIDRYIKVTPRAVAERIVASLGPPCCKMFKRTEVDLVGPFFALLLLTALVHRGYSIKDPTITNTLIGPLTAVLSYALIVPFLGFVLCKLGRANIGFWDLTGLIGYTLFSHIFTLCVSLWIYQESNTSFFICLFVFGGLSALRMCIILITHILIPAARLLVCSTLLIAHLLFLIFLHFAYMHPTFVYGMGTSKRVIDYNL